VQSIDQSINQSIKWVLGRSLIVGHRASLGRRLIGISRNGRRQTDRPTDGRTEPVAGAARRTRADVRRIPMSSCRAAIMCSRRRLSPALISARTDISDDRPYRPVQLVGQLLTAGQPGAGRTAVLSCPVLSACRTRYILMLTFIRRSVGLGRSMVRTTTLTAPRGGSGDSSAFPRAHLHGPQ